MSEINQRQTSSSPTRRAVSPEAREKKERAEQAMRRRAQVQPSLFEKYGYHIVIGIFLLICLYALFSILTRSTQKLTSIPVIDLDEIQAHNSLGSYLQGPNDFFKVHVPSTHPRTGPSAKPSSYSTITSPSRARSPSVSPPLSTFPSHTTSATNTPSAPSPSTTKVRRSPYPPGNCSSSYSIAAVSATSDRLCITKKGEFLGQLSPQLPISCDDRNYKCGGGSVVRVFEVGKKSGFVTRECLQYTGDENIKESCNDLFNNCEKYKIHDNCVSTGEEQIKREIFTRGPVVAVISVFKDFLVYKGGIYEVTEGSSKY